MALYRRPSRFDEYPSQVFAPLLSEPPAAMGLGGLRGVWINIKIKSQQKRINLLLPKSGCHTNK
jgi:hypothetical protein